MPITLRIDLDYVPWDTPDAAEFGHGEPAMFLKLLDLARTTGSRYQFFVSNRVLRAFNAVAEAVLNEGHDLGWLSKHPEEESQRQEDAIRLFNSIGHEPVGICVRGAWPEESPFPAGFAYLSALPGPMPTGVRFFPLETKSDRDAIRAGATARSWTDTIKAQVRDAASRNLHVSICVRPQVLAKFDPRLAHIKEILELAQAVELPLRTFDQLVQS
jgi:hypothetical protein